MSDSSVFLIPQHGLVQSSPQETIKHSVVGIRLSQYYWRLGGEGHSGQSKFARGAGGQ